jgi:hypothetical protein
VFDVAEPDDIELPQSHARQLRDIQTRLTINPPAPNAPAVCVIDSGIQESHLLLEPAIDKSASRCFLPNTAETDVADYVPSGGHGTRVAGAVLYADDIRDQGTVDNEAWVQNARVLNDQCRLPEEVLPPALIRDVVQHYHNGPRQTRIFNHSINADAPCRRKHMSAWAAEIDRLCNEHDILIIQSIGNQASLLDDNASDAQGALCFLQKFQYPSIALCYRTASAEGLLVADSSVADAALCLSSFCCHSAALAS